MIWLILNSLQKASFYDGFEMVTILGFGGLWIDFQTFSNFAIFKYIHQKWLKHICHVIVTLYIFCCNSILYIVLSQKWTQRDF
jgi:hypothetical protein